MEINGSFSNNKIINYNHPNLCNFENEILFRYNFIYNDFFIDLHNNDAYKY